MTTTRVLARLGTIGMVGLLPLLGVGCSGGDDRASSATAPSADESAGGNGLTGSPGGEAPPSEQSGATATTTATATPATNPVVDRKLIIRMTVGVEVDDVTGSVDRVIALAEQHGGELSGSSMDLSDPRFAGGDLVFRLPPAETEAFIAALDPGIGRRTSLQTSTEDVTLQSTDLDTRIETARASLDRVRALLAEAKNIGEVITLEGELTDRQNTLEQLLTEKTYLDGQVAMSTVTVHLAATGTLPEKEDQGVAAAFTRGWNDFVDFLRGLVVAIGRSLPFVVFFALLGGAVWWVSRRLARRNRSVVPPRPPVQDEDPRTSAPGS